MKRFFSVFSVILLTAVLCAGCTLQSAQEESTGSGSDIELEVWLCYDRNVPGSYYVFLWDDLGEAYGYDIEVKTYTRQEIKTKLKVAMACNELPDIFYVPGDSFAETVFSSGLCYPVQEYLEGVPFRDEYVLPWEDGNNYVIPCAPSSCAVVYYDTELLEEMDLEIPETLDDLLELVWMVEAYNASNGTDYSTIELGMNDSWMGELLYCAAAQSLDADAYEAAVLGGTKQSDDVLADAAVYIEKLIGMNAFPENFTEIEEAEAVKDFINHNAVLMVHQSSLVYHLTQNMGADGFSLGLFPGCGDEDNAVLLDLNGSYSSGLAVSIGSDYADEAAALCLEFSERINQTNVEDYHYLSYMTTAYDSTDYYSENVSTLNTLVQNAETISFFQASLIPQDDADKWNTTVKKFYAGEIEAQDMLQDIGLFAQE